MTETELQELYQWHKDDFVMVGQYGQQKEIRLEDFIKMIRTVELEKPQCPECCL